MSEESTADEDSQAVKVHKITQRSQGTKVLNNEMLENLALTVLVLLHMHIAPSYIELDDLVSTLDNRYQMDVITGSHYCPPLKSRTIALPSKSGPPLGVAQWTTENTV